MFARHCCIRSPFHVVWPRCRRGIRYLRIFRRLCVWLHRSASHSIPRVNSARTVLHSRMTGMSYVVSCVQVSMYETQTRVRLETVGGRSRASRRRCMRRDPARARGLHLPEEARCPRRRPRDVFSLVAAPQNPSNVCFGSTLAVAVWFGGDVHVVARMSC